MPADTGKTTKVNVTGAPQTYAEGWYFHFRSQNIGPISLRELKGRCSSGELTSSDMAWHPAVDAWLPIREVLELSREVAQPGSRDNEHVLRQLRRTDRFVIRNALYLVMTSVPGLILLLSAVSMLTYPDSESIGLLLLLISLGLAWWAWLEYRGVQGAPGKIAFPARLSFWPRIMPYRTITIDLPSIIGVEFASQSDHAHLVILKTPDKDFKVIFDTIFARDSFLLMLSLRSIPVR